jgi:Tol biopolymer transport system component
VPIVSPDGRFVLFDSTANNLTLISNNVAIPVAFPTKANVFLRDRANGTTTLVSVNLSGTSGGNGDSLPANISTNGRYALFQSLASDLVPNDTNGARDVFIRDLVNNTTTLVSAGANGGVGNGASYDAVMTPDGRHVAFVSAASNLVPGDTNGIPDVFVRDLEAGNTMLASVGATLATPSSDSEAPQITPDGRYVAFYSTASNLVQGVPNTNDIYVRDMTEGITAWASTNARAMLAALGTPTAAFYNYVLSTDGVFVAYQTSTAQSGATLRPGAVFRYNQVAGLTDLVSTNASVTGNFPETLDMTPDGRFIAFVGYLDNSSYLTALTTCIYVWDAQSGASALASCDVSNAAPVNSFCECPTLDPTGQFVAFLADATNLVSNPVVRGYHLYLRDLVAGSTSLVDADTNGAGPVHPSSPSQLSMNGDILAFVCPDGLAPNDWNQCSDVLVRDMTTNTVELVSVRNPALPSLSPNGPSTSSTLSLSADGRYVTFSSLANNLVANDTNNCRDIFVCDLLGGSNVLVSVGSDGVTCANGSSSDPVISPDGRYVLFCSAATNLVAGDTNKASDVFVRDLQAGTTTLVSVNSSGTRPGNLPSTPISISLGAQYVLFASSAQNLTPAPGQFGDNPNLFVRHMTAAHTYALSPDGFCDFGTMTPDGRFVAFLDGQPPVLYVWDSQSATRIYTNTTSSIGPYAMSPDGNQIVFFSGTTLWAVNRAAHTQLAIVSGINSGASPRFSADGRFLAYGGQQTGAIQIFLYDFQTGNNRLISQNASGTAGNGNSDLPSFGIGDRFIAYRSKATNLLPGATNGLPNVFLYDLQAGVTTLISTSRSDGSAASDLCISPVFSGDGRTLIFESRASELTPQDFNQDSDVFAFYILSAAILPETLLGQGPCINWLMVPGQTGQVQFKNSLTDPNWQDLPGTVTVQGNQQSILDSTAPSNQRFYRIVPK